MWMEIVAIMWGDPHIQTLDKLEYTFNGLGEYFMVKSDSLELQARTARAWDNQRQPSVTGTVFSAVAGRALYEESNTTVSSAPVHVEMSADRTTGRLHAIIDAFKISRALCFSFLVSLYAKYFHWPQAVEIWYTASDIEPDYSHVTKNYNFWNSTWRLRPSWKSFFWPILINRLSDFSEILYEKAERHADKGYGTKNANV